MGEKNGEPPAAPSNDRRDAPDEVCERCGTSIDTSDWYPVTKERDSDGTLRLYPFCSEACRDAWVDDRRG